MFFCPPQNWQNKTSGYVLSLYKKGIWETIFSPKSQKEEATSLFWKGLWPQEEFQVLPQIL